jgi:hypothetical protein
MHASRCVGRLYFLFFGPRDKGRCGEQEMHATMRNASSRDIDSPIIEMPIRDPYPIWSPNLCFFDLCLSHSLISLRELKDEQGRQYLVQCSTLLLFCTFLHLFRDYRILGRSMMEQRLRPCPAKTLTQKRAEKTLRWNYRLTELITEEKSTSGSDLLLTETTDEVKCSRVWMRAKLLTISYVVTKTGHYVAPKWTIEAFGSVLYIAQHRIMHSDRKSRSRT